MQKVIHRINTVEQLKKIPTEYGVEIDLRGFGKDIILNHEALEGGESFKEYIKHYNHSFIILNIKEAGIEEKVIDIVENYGIKDYFVLDVEFPYLYRASRNGVRNIAIRYSEDECIETVLKYKGMIDWVWIDTNTILPLDKQIIEKLKGFKTCLVCPERWGRPKDIKNYINKMKLLDFKPNAVMTAFKYVNEWDY